MFKIKGLHSISNTFKEIDKGFLLLGLMAMFVIYPLLQSGLPATADTPIHFYRTLEFSRSWENGVIYPRWAPDLAYGYGYPLWSFAPPLPYLIPLAFQNIGFSLETALKGLIILTIGLGYALGTYLFVRAILGAKAGLVGATIYTLAPFALRELLLYGGNYPQYLAIGLYPWALWAFGRVSREGHWVNILMSAIFYGAIILSHLFHALIITPIILGYIIISWLSYHQALKQRLSPILGLSLGLLGTAFFWLPAFIERNITRAVESVYTEVSPFSLRFLTWQELLAWPQPLDSQAANPWVPFSLGPAAIGLAILGIIALWHYKHIRLIWLHTLFFSLVLLGSIFMLLPVSTWAWETIPFIAVAEFPWRLLGLTNLSLAFLGSACVYIYKAPSPQIQTTVSIGGLILVLFSSSVYLYPFRPFTHHGDRVADMASYEMATRTIGTTTLGEYLPQWVETVPHTSPLAQAMKQGKTLEKLDRTSLPPEAKARLIDHSAIRDRYHFSSSHPFQARFWTYYYPGWTAYIDEKAIDIDIEAKSGFITLAVPAGEHDVYLHFVDTPLRKIANAISLLTIGILLSIGIYKIIYGGSMPLKKSQTPLLSSPPWGTTRATFFGGGVLLALLLLKLFIIDTHTAYFRQQSPPGQVAKVQHPLKVNLDNQIWLLGYDINQDTLIQGNKVQVVLYWQAQHALKLDYRSFVHLDTSLNQRTWAVSDNFHPGDATAQIDIPTSTWTTTHYIRDEHFLSVPPNTPPIRFNLRAGLYNPKDGQRLAIAGTESNSIILQEIEVMPNPNLHQAEIPNPIQYKLGEHIHLQGYDWNSDKNELTLFWHNNQALDTDYVVFVHLLDPQKQLAWGADAPPLEGLYPTSAWHPNTTIVDSRHLTPSNLPHGTYILAVGMYNPNTLDRLPVTDANNKPINNNIIYLDEVTF